MERHGHPVTDAELFEARDGPMRGWPDAAATERAYLEAFASRGSEALIANLRTRVLGLRYGDRIFPVTVNKAEYGDAYVCLPHTAYALYARAELGIVDAGPWTPVLSVLADVMGGVLRAARANRIVHLNNWMVSTNLHCGWSGDGLAVIRELLVRRFPRHIIGIRSLNGWSDAALVERCRADRWTLLPSRQIYVTDDLSRDWAPRRNTRRDTRLLSKTPYRVDPLDRLQPGDSRRIAELYGMLYLRRYSTLNPAFTADYIDMTHREGILAYRGLRRADGVLVAVVGCLVRGDVMTTPIVGYDTSRPAKEGLYRMASVLFAQMAQERALRLNGSAGAADFKRHRGARAVIEYSAYFTGHLAWPRRLAIFGLGWMLNGLLVPMMVRRGL